MQALPIAAAKRQLAVYSSPDHQRPSVRRPCVSDVRRPVSPLPAARRAPPTHRGRKQSREPVAQRPHARTLHCCVRCGGGTGTNGRADPGLEFAASKAKIMHYASLAQLAEHLTLNQRVEGSSPSGGTGPAGKEAQRPAENGEVFCLSWACVTPYACLPYSAVFCCARSCAYLASGSAPLLGLPSAAAGRNARYPPPRAATRRHARHARCRPAIGSPCLPGSGTSASNVSRALPQTSETGETDAPMHRACASTYEGQRRVQGVLAPPERGHAEWPAASQPEPAVCPA